MKKVILLALGLMFLSCEKEEVAPFNIPSLKLPENLKPKSKSTITGYILKEKGDYDHEDLIGADVYLFKSLEDLFKQKVFKQTTTNERGMYKFDEDIDMSQDYYIVAEKDCYNNLWYVFDVEKRYFFIGGGAKERKKSLILEEIGNVTIINNTNKELTIKTAKKGLTLQKVDAYSNVTIKSVPNRKYEDPIKIYYSSTGKLISFDGRITTTCNKTTVVRI